MTTRTLHVLRHAKSRWDQPVTDHERGLAPRGNRALVQLSAYVADQGIRPDVVLTSTARRAFETLEGVRAALGDPEVQALDRLYGASATDIVALVRATDPALDTVLVVGHNPGLHDLVVRLAHWTWARRRDREVPDRSFGEPHLRGRVARARRGGRPCSIVSFGPATSDLIRGLRRRPNR